MKQKFHEDDTFIFRFFPAALHVHRADETNDTFSFIFLKVDRIQNFPAPPVSRGPHPGLPRPQ
ncbi:MAG: hypothetical protein EBZ77_16585 [Chitinophagia bacterium]|nr:hypothetical protein [Chitinophagia bacterium]